MQVIMSSRGTLVLYKYCKVIHFFIFKLQLASFMAHTHCDHAVLFILLRLKGYAYIKDLYRRLPLITHVK